jgi:cytochrome c peroxidase
LLAAGAMAGCGPASPTAAADAAQSAPEFQMTIPPAITPLPATPAADSDKIRLGKRLFLDTRLSADGTVSCATCHDVAKGGDDGRRVSVGVGGRPGKLNTPTVLNSGLNFAQFWDGRAVTLEEQVRDTLRNPDEMGTEPALAATKLRADSTLVDAFARVYADGLTAENVVDAVAAYVRALVTPGAPFDRYLGGDDGALDPEAKQGYTLFVQLGCISCHQGRNIGGNLFQRFGVMGSYIEDRGNVTRADYGRFNVTGRESDRYVFKVPSLRNVAQTAPYFHDGSAETLSDAVTVMLEYQLGRPAPEEQIEALVAFLDSLTAEVPAALR